MEKIASIITNGKINTAYDWVLAGKGTATQMWDGIPYAVINGAPYRHVVTARLVPDMLLSGSYDGQFWGWEPVPAEDAVFWPVWKRYDRHHWNWSYEVVGPEINGNPEGWPSDTAATMIPHGTLIIQALKRPTLDTIREYLSTHDVEGIVWWKNVNDLDCEKVKVQQSDLKLKRHRRRT